MVVEQQQVVLVIDREESCAEQEAGGEIKWCGALLLQPLLDDGIGVATSERFCVEVEGSRGVDDLEHFTAFHAEGGAQGWMTFDQSGHGLAQSFELEVAAEPPEGWQVIGGEIRFELMEEPEAGLGVGGRICMAAFTPMARAGVGGLDFTAASLRKHFEIRLG